MEPGRVQRAGQALTVAEAKPARPLARVLDVVGPIRPAVHGVMTALLSQRTRDEDPDTVDYLRECLVRADRKALANAIRSISLGRPDLRPLLPGITASTLLVTTAEGSSVDGVGGAPGAAATMPNAVATVVPGARTSRRWSRRMRPLVS